MLVEVLRLISKKAYRHRHRQSVSKPRKPGPKPHKYMTQKNCCCLRFALTWVNWAVDAWTNHTAKI